jgi:hypothetical protein
MPPAVIHNTHRQWYNDVANEITDPATGAMVKEAFFEGKAVKELVKPNWPIYKFNDYPTLAAGPEPWRTLSPWWSPYDEHHHDGGWEARARFAAHLGISIRELGRMTSVIRESRIIAPNSRDNRAASPAQAERRSSTFPASA